MSSFGLKLYSLAVTCSYKQCLYLNTTRLDSNGTRCVTITDLQKLKSLNIEMLITLAKEFSGTSLLAQDWEVGYSLK